jgi:cobaltochelatase CobN
MSLRFGGARADRGPGDEFGQVLRHDGIKRFGAGGQAQLGDVQQQLAREENALLNVKGIIQIRIVDQSLPAHGGARLLEVHAHDRKQGGFNLHRQGLEARRVLAGGGHIVDGTGSDHHEQARVAALQYCPHGLARFVHRLGRAGCHRQAPFNLFRRCEQIARCDIDVLQLILNIRH